MNLFSSSAHRRPIAPSPHRPAQPVIHPRYSVPAIQAHYWHTYVSPGLRRVASQKEGEKQLLRCGLCSTHDHPCRGQREATPSFARARGDGHRQLTLSVQRLSPPMHPLSPPTHAFILPPLPPRIVASRRQCTPGGRPKHACWEPQVRLLQRLPPSSSSTRIRIHSCTLRALLSPARPTIALLCPIAMPMAVCCRLPVVHQNRRLALATVRARATGLVEGTATALRHLKKACALDSSNLSYCQALNEVKALVEESAKPPSSSPPHSQPQPQPAPGTGPRPRDRPPTPPMPEPEGLRPEGRPQGRPAPATAPSDYPPRAGRAADPPRLRTLSSRCMEILMVVVNIISRIWRLSMFKPLRNLCKRTVA